MIDNAKGTIIREKEFYIEGFKLVKSLGAGGFASTFLYADLYKQYGEYVAVKIPHNKTMESFLVSRDGLSLAALRNIENIVEIHGIKQVKDKYVLIMEYVEGPTLRDLIGQSGSGITLTLKKTLKYIIQIATGLKAAHERKIIHRDIKPENIIIERKTDTPKILDFGISSIQSRKTFKTQHCAHTPFYSPPEILTKGEGDYRVDIYSLGITFYEMLTGFLPYYHECATEYQIIEMIKSGTPKSPRLTNPEVSLHLQQAILKAIAYRPEERFQSMDEFITSLIPPKELELAKEYITHGDTKRAERIIRSFIDKNPQDIRGYEMLANLLSSSLKLEEAQLNLLKAIDLDPQNPALLMKLSGILAKLNKPREALAYLHSAQTHCPDLKLKRRITLLIKNLERPNKE